MSSNQIPAPASPPPLEPKAEIVVGDVDLFIEPECQDNDGKLYPRISVGRYLGMPTRRDRKKGVGYSVQSMHGLIGQDIVDTMFALWEFMRRGAPWCAACKSLGGEVQMRPGMPGEYEDTGIERGSLYVCDVCHGRTMKMKLAPETVAFYQQIQQDIAREREEIEQAFESMLGPDRALWPANLEKHGIKPDACPVCENDTDNPADLDTPKPECAECKGTGLEAFQYDAALLEDLVDALNQTHDEPQGF